MSRRRRRNKRSLAISPSPTTTTKKRRISSEKPSIPYQRDSDSNSNSSPSPSPVPSKNGIEPWWIGQRIKVNTLNPKKNNKKSTFKIASIRDYNPFTKLSHIWFENDGKFENVDLLKMDYWSIENDSKISDTLQFIPSNGWIPMYYEIGSYVLVKSDCAYDMGSEIVAVIDGYDPISRRYHVQYTGGQISEWLWATKGKVKPYTKQANKQLNTNFLLPPPWNPKAYCLDAAFAVKSKEIEQNRHSSRAVENYAQIKKETVNTFGSSLPSLDAYGYYMQILPESDDLYEAARILCSLKSFQK